MGSKANLPFKKKIPLDFSWTRKAGEQLFEKSDLKRQLLTQNKITMPSLGEQNN